MRKILNYWKWWCVAGFVALVGVLGVTLTKAGESVDVPEGDDRPQEERFLRWAADVSSGVPYVFEDPRNTDDVIGFEVEIIEAIAHKLGRVPVFINNEWDGLIPGLNRGLYDVVIDGMVILPTREEGVSYSDPYYVSQGVLITRVEEEGIYDLADCQGKTVGVLRGALTEKILEDVGEIDVRRYYNEINILTDLKHGRLDAGFIDGPEFMYYGQGMPELKRVGRLHGRFEYGILMHLDATQLRVEINAALKELKDSGELREILERWNLWNSEMAQLLDDYSESSVGPVEYEKYVDYFAQNQGWRKILRRYIGFMPLLGRAAWATMQISVMAMILAMAVGLMLALLRVYTHGFLCKLAGIFIEVVRGTPVLIQLYFIFYGLPSIGIKLDSWVSGIVALGLNYSAYEAENYRAGILAVPDGQLEAARALGMSHWQAVRHVVIPQAFRFVMPPLTNDFISLIKDSSLVSVITIVELTQAYNHLAATYHDYFGLGLLVAGVYLLLGMPFVYLAKKAERRLKGGKRLRKKSQPGVF